MGYVPVAVRTLKAQGYTVNNLNLGIPTTVIVDRTGQMRFRILGRVRPGQLDQLIDELG